MDREISEFTDTYSDDIIFLLHARASLLRHPLKYYYPPLLDATLARLYAVMMVGNTENAIKQEFERTGDSRLEDYLTPRLDNRQKINALSSYLQERLNRAVDTEILEDYLAIKYLRNGIIHSDQQTNSRAEHVIARGLPLDSRELNLNHLNQFSHVDQAITFYLGILPHLERVNISDRTLEPIDLPATSNVIGGDESRPYSFDEFTAIHRRNLDKIGISWREFLFEADEVSNLDAIRKIRDKNSDDGASDRIKEWGRLAEYSWSEILRLNSDDSAQRLIEDAEYRAELLDRARSFAVENTFPVGPFPAEFSNYLWRFLLEDNAPDLPDLLHLFGGNSSLTGKQILETYVLGSVAYDLIPLIGRDWIWPLFAQGNTQKAVKIADSFIDIVELGHTWYSAVEMRKSLDSTFKGKLAEERRLITELKG